jgi:hypothetical protein
VNPNGRRNVYPKGSSSLSKSFTIDLLLFTRLARLSSIATISFPIPRRKIFPSFLNFNYSQALYTPLLYFHQRAKGELTKHFRTSMIRIGQSTQRVLYLKDFPDADIFTLCPLYCPYREISLYKPMSPRPALAASK